MKDMENILQKKIGIVGCGEMGLPMLEVLLKNKKDDCPCFSISKMR